MADVIMKRLVLDMAQVRAVLAGTQTLRKRGGDHAMKQYPAYGYRPAQVSWWRHRMRRWLDHLSIPLLALVLALVMTMVA
jgi:hypothetical protein